MYACNTSPIATQSKILNTFISGNSRATNILKASLISSIVRKPNFDFKKSETTNICISKSSASFSFDTLIFKMVNK